MKVLIIEGPDNCGKDTLISNISSKYNIVKIIHCTTPPKDIDNMLPYQAHKFEEYINIATHDYESNLEDILIFNRSHYGEYVYGQLYRNELSDNIYNMINLIDWMLYKKIKQEDLCYIQLTGSPRFLCKNDDGLSLSENKLYLVEKECELFSEVFNLSKIENKHMIYVNSGQEFRSELEITNECLNYLK